MDRQIPGTYETPGRRFIYIQGRPGSSGHELIKTVLAHGQTEKKQLRGGVMTENCRIDNSDGCSFHGFSCKGDVDEWMRMFFVGAEALSLLTAEIIGSELVVSNGLSFPLSSCKVTFY